MASSSSGANGISYDVFLSFRGQDTRHSFSDHLYDALTRAGIHTFRDNEEINRGEEISLEIERAIKESRASIIVLSENYATSTWCLDELVLILKQRRECNHFVLPVFYHVDPSDVRKQNKNFAIQIKSCSRWTHENVSMWKKALVEVADLAAMVLDGPESKFLKKIVDTIYNKLDHKEVHLPPNITGMDTRYEEITSWLNQPNSEFLAICGMGGSGKTTLAKYIYDLNWKYFENVSFIEDIGSRCKGVNNLVEVQEQLLKDILGGKKRKLPGVSRGTFKIEEVMQAKRTLIVLDDIVERSQILVLLGAGKINAQSKIIITTRNNTDDWFEFSYWKCQKYQMELLNDDESLELLSRHAFGSKIPISGFEDLALRAVRYCDGNPLALEVLGSSLCMKNTFETWISQLNLLKKDIDSRIQDILIRSYMSLTYDSEKELFLHIACFFIGKDMDYVITILERDYSATTGIKTLINRYLVSVSPNKKLMMHRLIQEMGKKIVRKESTKFPEKRSRVWLSSESYKILSKRKGSKTMEGLALDMQILSDEKSSDLNTDALKKMDNLKLLQLNSVQLNGSYEKFSEDLRWLCWLRFHLRTIPSDFYMGNLVAIDMSYSNLEVFEPPMVLQCLQILNLKDSHNLLEIRNIDKIPHLETLILWNCYSLVLVCETIGYLSSLTLLNMTGCKNLCKREQTNLLLGPSVSTSRETVAVPTFSFPPSLRRLFLKDCYLECTDSFPLSFSVQPYLQYLNLGNSLFKFLPYYGHLKNLRVLDLSLCSKLKWLLDLPSTLAELYIYYCESLEKITFESHQFTLLEFGYKGCISLYEIEGFIKLLPIAKLDETDLGHMKWLKEYQNHEMCLIGDDDLTIGRSQCVQMLYEFDIMSTSLPDIKDLNLKPDYKSESPSLSFDVPMCPKSKKLKGIIVTLKYTLSGDDWAWFAKISRTNGVDLMYNPKIFGKPEFGEVGIWLSYWPIGNSLDAGDKVNICIVVMNGLEVHQCGVSLVYTDEEVGKETIENNMGWVDSLGGNFSRFQLSTGAYYLCRRDFFELMEVGRLTPSWFRILVGDIIDYTEVRGWRNTGLPKHMNPSFTELKTVRCIIDGPELEDIYKKSGAFEEEKKSGSGSELVDKGLEKKEVKMLMLVDCSNCRTPLQLPTGDRSIRCAVCQAITHVADPRSLPPPLPPQQQPHASSSNYNYHVPPPQQPSPYNHLPSFSQTPSVNGKKRAVICGISYKRTKHELKGCINDAKCMKYLLINKFKFPESSILMLTEEETDRYRIPTKHNIRMAMYWLVQGCQAGDSLVFHYSGHGSQQRNYTGDEIDGYDETLCPLDFETQGMIVDDEINATIVKPLPHGVRLHAIIDACHSGTMLDLPFLCRMDRSGRYVWEDHSPQSGVFKGTNGGEVISFSGSDDDQSSADTASLSKVTSTGAMTFSFIQAIERGHGTTYGDMLTSMRTTIRKNETDVGGGSGGAVTPLLGMLLTGGSLGGGLRQEPQLTASEPFDVYTKRFSL